MDSLRVLVPVLDRPQNVKPLVESFRASGAPGGLTFVCTAGDEAEIAAVQACGADLLVSEAVSWPAKVAVGVGARDAEWFLLGADDVSFEPGWWEATAALRGSGVEVIGTQDGANPRVLAGAHSTHTLVRRGFRAIGEPVSPVHQGYRHWYVDDELVATAKARGVWAFCDEARITHRHPYFDASVPFDETYRAGEAGAAQDRALHHERLALIYAEGRPFPHMVLDGIFEEAALDAVLDEWPTEFSKHFDGPHEAKAELSDLDSLPDPARKVLDSISFDLAPFLGHLCGIDGLVPSLVGGGCHDIGPGGHLDVHSDFSQHPHDPNLYRRLNVLLYLNRDWDPAWGGALLLVDDDGQPVQSIEPAFNRLVVFSTSRRSWHGHPDPLACPPGRSRRSLAVYFFSPEPPADFAPQDTTWL